MKRANKAFTLIELLIVIAIIGILAVIIFVSLSSARKRAQDTQIKADISSMAKALTIMRVDTPLPPTAGGAWLRVTDTGSTIESISTWVDGDGQRLMQVLPVNPLGVKYRIYVNSSGQFALVSQLNDDNGANRYACSRDGSTMVIPASGDPAIPGLTVAQTVCQGTL